jgi:AraC-like DNA-binding protein
VIGASAFGFGFHAAACGLFLVIAGLLWRDRRALLSGRLGAALAISAAADALASESGFHLYGTVWFPAILVLSWGGSVLFWLWARAVFDDDFGLRWRHAAYWAAIVGAGLFCAYGGARSAPLAGVVEPTLPFVTLAIVLAAGVQTLRSWRSDLVEGRRRLRFVVLAGGIGYSVANTLLRLPVVALPLEPATRNALDAGCLLGLACLASWSVLQAARLEIVEETTAPSRQIDVDYLTVVKAGRTIADPAILRRLERLMTEERVYREEGLSIGALALKVGAPEYRLRRAINEGLGYRNFNAFLNHYRIAEAKAALADIRQKDVPILTIAMDAGFQSLGPFNRAFKAEAGATPTEYRRSALSSLSHNALTDQESFKIGKPR